MKSIRRIRSVVAMGALGCSSLAITPLGCTNSIEMAPVRYRAEAKGPRLPDISVERLQACFEEHGGQFDADSLRVLGNVKVDPEGRTREVTVAGIPDSAPDFAACVRVTLNDMAVPMSMFPLRPRQMAELTDGQAAPRGNELANPIVVWELGAALAEFAAQHGNRVVLYAVAVEVVTTVAVVATKEYLRRRKKKTCTEHLQDCLGTPTNDLPGNHMGQRRCAACFLKCRDGNWPLKIDLPDGGSCAYWRPATSGATMRIDNYTRDLNSPLDPKEVAFCRKFEAILVGALEMEYGDVVRAFRQLEDEFVHRVDYNEWEVLETQRRIAEGILCVAHDAEQPFDVCRNNWNALVELGFSSIEMFCNMAWFYADCCLLNAQYDTGLEVLDMVVEEIHRRLEVPGLTSHAEKYYDTELDHLGTLREGLNAYKSSEAEGNAWDERRDAESEAQESSAQERQKNEIICKLFSATKPLRATSSDRGFDELVAEYRRAEAGFLERLESGDELFVPDVRRHFATTILEEAQQRHAPLEVCNAAWNELVRWGFGDLEHRCAVTRVYAECCLFNQQPDAGLAVVEPLLAKIQNDVDEGTDKQMSRQRYSRKIAHLTKLRDELLALKT